jgi:hypothetical protein
VTLALQAIATGFCQLRPQPRGRSSENEAEIILIGD